MTDKVQKIREKVEKLKSRLIRGACASQIVMETYCKEEAYNEVLAILDSMKEEPVSEDFEIALASEWKAYNDRGAATVDALEDNTQELAFAKGFYRGAKWKEQKDSIVSDDLEEAADNALNNVLNTHEIVNVRSCLEMFKFGSNWKEQQMIANAIDAEVLENYDGKVIKYDDTILDEKLSNCKVFDKVKVIVIKEK